MRGPLDHFQQNELKDQGGRRSVPRTGKGTLGRLCRSEQGQLQGRAADVSDTYMLPGMRQRAQVTAALGHSESGAAPG